MRIRIIITKTHQLWTLVSTRKLNSFLLSSSSHPNIITSQQWLASYPKVHGTRTRTVRPRELALLNTTILHAQSRSNLRIPIRTNRLQKYRNRARLSPRLLPSTPSRHTQQAKVYARGHPPRPRHHRRKHYHRRGARQVTQGRRAGCTFPGKENGERFKTFIVLIKVRGFMLRFRDSSVYIMAMKGVWRRLNLLLRLLLRLVLIGSCLEQVCCPFLKFDGGKSSRDYIGLILNLASRERERLSNRDMLVLRVSVKLTMMVTSRCFEDGLPMIRFGRICGLPTLRRYSGELGYWWSVL